MITHLYKNSDKIERIWQSRTCVNLSVSNIFAITENPYSCRLLRRITRKARRSPQSYWRYLSDKHNELFVTYGNVGITEKFMYLWSLFFLFKLIIINMISLKDNTVCKMMSQRFSKFCERQKSLEIKIEDLIYFVFMGVTDCTSSFAEEITLFY